MNWRELEKWRHGKLGGNVGDYMSKKTIQGIDRSFANSPNYTVAHLNGKPIDGRFTLDKEFTVASGITVYKFLTKVYNEMHDGDILYVKDRVCLIEDVYTSEVSKTATIRECKYNLEIENKFGEIEFHPIVIDTRVRDTKQLRYHEEVILPSESIKVTVSFNMTTQNIRAHDRFIIGSSAWEVEAINDILRVNSDGTGLIEMSMRKVPLKENEKPDLIEEDIKIEIYGSDSMERKSEEQYTLKVFYKGIEVDYGLVEWKTNLGTITDEGVLYSDCETGIAKVIATVHSIDGCNVVKNGVKNVEIYNKKDLW